MSSISAFILVTLFYSCADNLQYDLAGNDSNFNTSRVSRSTVTCRVNRDFTPGQASNIRLGLERCDNAKELTYELANNASQYFKLDHDNKQLVATENLLAQHIGSIEDYGFIKVYNQDKLIEERSIKVRALAIPAAPHEDIIACYPLDGDGTDLTGFANHATAENAVIATGINETPDGALNLDGESGTISAPHQDHLNLTEAFTLSAWVKIEERKTQTIIRKGAIINGEYSVPFALGLSQTGDIVFAMHNKQDTRFEARKHDYPLCEWVHLAATYDKGEMKLYQNGKLVQDADGPPVANTNDSPLIIGTRLQLRSDTVNGSIDEVRIYGTALSAEEVADLSLQNLN